MTPAYWLLAGLGLVIALVILESALRRGKRRPLSAMRPNRQNDTRAPLGQEAIDRDAFAVNVARNAALATMTGATKDNHSWAAQMAIPVAKVGPDATATNPPTKRGD
jgi:hypothetical protein